MAVDQTATCYCPCINARRDLRDCTCTLEQLCKKQGSGCLCEPETCMCQFVAWKRANGMTPFPFPANYPFGR